MEINIFTLLIMKKYDEILKIPFDLDYFESQRDFICSDCDRFFNFNPFASFRSVNLLEHCYYLNDFNSFVFLVSLGLINMNVDLNVMDQKSDLFKLYFKPCI